MVRFRSWLAGGLRRLGNRVFRYLSDRDGARGLNRWLKFTVLGLVLSAVTCASAGKKPDASANIKTCYMPIYEPDIILSSVGANPNPSAGADSVKVQVLASTFDDSDADYIARAHMVIDDDKKNVVQMQAADGKFSDNEEMVEGYVDVTGMEPGICRVYVTVYSANNLQGSISIPFEVSSAADSIDEVETDTTEVKEQEDA